MIPLQVKSSPIGDRMMRNLLYWSLRQGCFWHLVSGQIVRQLPHGGHAPGKQAAAVVQFFKISEEQS
jgi:hypothetical protein